MTRPEPAAAERPAARWALGVIDVENDFCEGGSLAVDGGTEVARRTRAWMDAEPQRWTATFATADRHPAVLPGHFAEPGDAPDLATTWPPHCVSGTPGAELHPLLLTGATEADRFDTLVAKGQATAAYSGFEGTAADGSTLEAWLRARRVDGVELCGLATDHCVRATALDALAAGFRVRVVADLCAGITPATTAAALAELAAAGAEVTTTAELAAR